MGRGSRCCGRTRKNDREPGSAAQTSTCTHTHATTYTRIALRARCCCVRKSLRTVYNEAVSLSAGTCTYQAFLCNVLVITRESCFEALHKLFSSFFRNCDQVPKRIQLEVVHIILAIAQSLQQLVSRSAALLYVSLRDRLPQNLVRISRAHHTRQSD